MIAVDADHHLERHGTTGHFVFILKECFFSILTRRDLANGRPRHAFGVIHQIVTGGVELLHAIFVDQLASCSWPFQQLATLASTSPTHSSGVRTLATMCSSSTLLRLPGFVQLEHRNTDAFLETGLAEAGNASSEATTNVSVM